jgi:hypothetical protein
MEIQPTEHEPFAFLGGVQSCSKRRGARPHCEIGIAFLGTWPEAKDRLNSFVHLAGEPGVSPCI